MGKKKSNLTKKRKFWGFLFIENDVLIFEEDFSRKYLVDMGKSSPINFKSFLWEPVEVIGKVIGRKIVILNLSILGNSNDDEIFDEDIYDTNILSMFRYQDGELRELKYVS